MTTAIKVCLLVMLIVTVTLAIGVAIIMAATFVREMLDGLKKGWRNE